MSCLSHIYDLAKVRAVTSYSYICTDHKYERDRKLRDRLDSDQFKGGNGSSQLRQFVYFQSCSENFHTLDEVVTWDRLTQERDKNQD